MNEESEKLDDPSFPPTADDVYDAGEMGCGELIIKLKMRMGAMQPAQILQLIALDNGAIEDIPAWCRMTGHQLKLAHHPQYWIERRTD